MNKTIEQLSIDTIRNLCLDSVENANTGHLGMPLGSSPMAYVLWKKIMNHNPKNTNWFNRDRFILTSGHGSILLYSLMHLSGYPLGIDDLKQFRQLGSKTPGHPEVTDTKGVEATTGPLGQGFSMSVGFAIAEARLADMYNEEDIDIINHYTYTICGDGDLQEGVALEAAAVAGELGLEKLIVLYDSNDVTSDGPIELSNTANVKGQFEALGWNYLRVEDGCNLTDVENAILKAQQVKGQPTIIEVKNIIGNGSPSLQGTEKIHSNPVGIDEATRMKELMNWPLDKKFYVPEDVQKHFGDIVENGQNAEADWGKKLDLYEEKYPEKFAKLMDTIENKVIVEEPKMPFFKDDKVATRTASGLSLNHFYQSFDRLVGGSADLASSNKTTIENAPFMSNQDFSGPNIHFGVREFSMASIMNGATLHGGLRGYCGTFLVFSDYMRSAIRHAALMKLPMIFIFTHDSMQVGPDGPTHQPVEHLLSLRAMPNLNVLRPADANETLYAWKLALESKETPHVLALGRHDVKVLEQASLEGVSKGAYIISASSSQEKNAIIIATGSEVEMAIEAQEKLAQENIFVDVVSMTSWELFEQQSDAYKESILPTSQQNRISVEMGSTMGWEKYVGPNGLSIGVNEYGASSPVPDLLAHLDFTVDRIVTDVKKVIQ